MSERQAQAKLDFASRKSCRETKRLARRNVRRAVHRKGRSERCSYHVVNAGIIRMIGKIEALCRKQQRGFLAHLESAAQTHVEISEARTDSRIAARSRRAIVRKVTVTINVRSGKQVEGVAAVVAEDRRQFKSPEDLRPLERTCKNARDNYLVPLVKVGKRPLALQARGVERRVIAVKVRRFIDGFAVRVVRQHREMIRKTFLGFEDSAVVNRRTNRTVHIVLKDRLRRVRETQCRVRHACGRAPVLKRQSVGRESRRSGVE